MNSHEAREILALFRPGTADEQDSSFDAARQWAKSDPETATWFEEHCQTHRLLRQKFQAIPVPPGLKEQILSERKIQRPLFQRYWGLALAAAAVVALLLGIESGTWPLHFSSDHYSAYEKRMVKMALSDYYMDLVSKDTNQIRAYLKGKDAPADYSLPTGMVSASAVGCAVPTWLGNRVAMICYKTGRPLLPGVQNDLWLFVIDRKALPNAPTSPQPVFDRVNKATTASWSDADHTYLLAVVGDEAFLSNYLQ